ncbi:MAG: hypothetical protein PHX61_10895 [Alphaproteobacteria bacterium]|nr:hypothetical protein [Alphaproteobacteria bacterium]
MPNNIVLAKKYTDLLDEVYCLASVTSDLTGDASMMRAGANANEILYPQVAVSGLGDYDRNSGYTNGTVDVEWATTKFNYDRGTKISVDSMDDEETFNVAFGKGVSELMRTKVAPEADAFTFATICGLSGISKATPAAYSNASDFLAALITAKNTMDEDEVPEENRYLYATPTLINGIMALDTTKSREIMNTFAAVKKVPQSRFYTAIDLLDGKTTGETAGHYRKHGDHYVECESTDTGALHIVANTETPSATEIKLSSVTPVEDSTYTPAVGDYVKVVSGKDLNFMIIHKPCLIKFDKHVVGSMIHPDNNPDSDSWISKYRKYGIVDVYANKRAGIYISHKI